MKVTREQAALNRERVLEVAAQLFREKGFDGIGVADLMKAAGLTHGGFYGQFSSKEELAALACERALDKSATYWDKLIDTKAEPFNAMIGAYLSTAHRDNPGSGCTLAALGAEAQRRDPSVQRIFTAGLERLLAQLTRILPSRSKAARRQQALTTIATLVGAQVLARATDDEKLAKEVLQAVKFSLLEN